MVIRGDPSSLFPDIINGATPGLVGLVHFGNGHNPGEALLFWHELQHLMQKHRVEMIAGVCWQHFIPEEKS